jgi:hypothetical protein
MPRPPDPPRSLRVLRPLRAASTGWWTSLAATAALALSACGGTAAGDVADDEPTDPIAAFFGFDEFDEEGEQRFIEQQRRVEELVRECMAREGFDYVPMDPAQMVGSFPGEGLTGREFAEQYGYGMSTTYEESMDASDEFVDPNADQLEGMSEQERTAWEEALWGDMTEMPPPAEGDDGEVVVDGFGGGCQGEASEGVFGDPQSDEFTQLFDDYQEALEGDRRYRDAVDTWRDCMTGEGYDFTEPEDAFEAVDQRMQEIYEATDPTAGMSEDEIAALTPEQMEDLWSSVPEPDPELLAEVQEFEIAVAVADYDCQEGVRRATAEIGQEYLDAHRDEFERARDAMEELEG